MAKYRDDGSLVRTNEERLALKSSRAAEGVVAAADYKRDAQAAIDRITTLRAVRLGQTLPVEEVKRSQNNSCFFVRPLFGTPSEHYCGAYCSTGIRR
jgi:hypothetical protein